MKRFWWFRPLLIEQETDSTGEKKKSASRLLVLSGILFVILQTTLLPHFPAGPDLLLVFCVYLAMYHSSVGSAAGAFLLGYSLDSCSGAPMGMHAFAMSFIFTVVTISARCLWLYNSFLTLGIVLFAFLLKSCVLLLWGGEFGQASTALETLVSSKMLNEAGSALVITPVIFSLLYRGEECSCRV